MAHGWRKRLAMIGTGIVISAGLIGCHNEDKKTVTAPPVSKSAAAAAQRSTAPATIPGVMPPPGSITPTSPVGASQSNMSPQTGPTSGFGSAAPASPTMGYNTPQNFPAYPGSSGANPNNSGTIGGPTPQGAIGVGAPMPGMRPLSGPTSSNIPTGSPSDPVMISPTARAVAPGVPTTPSSSAQLPPMAELLPGTGPVPPAPPAYNGPQAPAYGGPIPPSVVPSGPAVNVPLAPVAP